MGDTWFGNLKWATRSLKVPLWLIALVVLGFFLTGCETATQEEKEKEKEGGTKITATTLTNDIWADGAITSGGEQWFRFTATAGTQYIHVNFGTLTDLYVQLHDNNGGTLGNRINLYGSQSFTSLQVTSGQTYLVKVTPDGSRTGTYRIGFNTRQLAPGTLSGAMTLFADVWVDGAISSGGQQWYRFTATSGTQYIHVNFGTLTDLYVQLYDSNGGTLGGSTNLYSYSSTRYISLQVTSGQTYYVRVTPYSSSGSGTYTIAFNTGVLAPGILSGAVTLSAGVWANGTISPGGEEWYKFTATAATQYIHVNFGTLTDLYVRLHDSNGGTLGNSINLYSFGTPYTSMLVTIGQTYYVRVTPYSSSGSGTYAIAFNTSSTPPTY